MRRQARRGGGRQVDLTIEAIGGRGDGIGRLGDAAGDRLVYVPGTAAGYGYYKKAYQHYHEEVEAARGGAA